MYCPSWITCLCLQRGPDTHKLPSIRLKVLKYSTFFGFIGGLYPVFLHFINWPNLRFCGQIWLANWPNPGEIIWQACGNEEENDMTQMSCELDFQEWPLAGRNGYGGIACYHGKNGNHKGQRMTPGGIPIFEAQEHVWKRFSGAISHA